MLILWVLDLNMEICIQVKISIERQRWVGRIQSRSLIGVGPGHKQVSSGHYVGLGNIGLHVRWLIVVFIPRLECL